MDKQQKCLADQIYDEQQKNQGQRKNTSATGASGVMTAYCVDGATLYCTMGSASSLLRVEDHGLRLTDRAAAHDGDTAPNKNIFPFGNCKLKKNDPCACPAPVGRWLLPDEYAVIGSCYAGKMEQFNKAGDLIDKARKAFEPLNAAKFLLPRQNMPQIEPPLRREIYRAVRELREQKERIALFSARTFADTAEAADYLEAMHNCAKQTQNAMDIIQNVLNSPEVLKNTLQKEFLSSPQFFNGQSDELKTNGMNRGQNLYENMMKELESGVLGGLNCSAREAHKQLFITIGSQAEKLMTEFQSLAEQGRAITEVKSEDMGYQLTMNSIIPCQIGGMIHF